jgi:uncharacterized protein (TIGR02217 family)
MTITTTFIEQRFPDGISWNCTTDESFNTDEVIVASGYVKTNINWDTPLKTFNVAHGLKNKQQIIELKSFFRMVMGKAIGFRFKDWNDYEVSITEGIINEGSPIGASKSFQLYKQYQFGNQIPSFLKITKPVNSALYPNNTTAPIAIYQNGVVVAPSNYSVNYSTGIVTLIDTFTVSPTDNFTWTGEFDIPAKFRNDTMKINQNNFDIYNWDSIEVMELR